MYFEFESDGRTFYTLSEFAQHSIALWDATPARLNFLIKFEEGKETRFVVADVLLCNGTIIPAVMSTDHLGFLREFVTASQTRCSDHG